MDPKQKAKKANQYLQSEEGQESLERSLETCRDRIRELKKMRKVDWKNLYVPMDI